MRAQTRGIHSKVTTVVVALLLLTGRMSLSVPMVSLTDSITVTSEPPRTVSSVSNVEMKPWRSLGALFLILCGLLTATYFLKRRGIAGFGALDLRRIQILEKHTIDAKRALLLVALDNHEFLLGVGPDRITPLHRQLRNQSNQKKHAASTKENIAS